METLVNVLQHAGTVSFALLALVTLRAWRRRGDAPSAWAAATFGSLAAIGIVGEFLPEDPQGAAAGVVVRILLAVLITFPYLLYRFTTAFVPSGRRVDVTAHVLTAAVVLASLALPSIPGPDDPRPGWFGLYIAAVLVQWTFLFVAAAVRLWRAGTGQPTVVRRRMRLLALGAAGMNLLIVVSGTASPEEASALQAATSGMALVAMALFFLGLAPPRAVRASWREAETTKLQHAVAQMMTATTVDEVTAVLLPRAGEILAGRAAALVDPRGEVIDAAGCDPAEVPALVRRDEADPGLLSIDLRAGRLHVWSSPYTPFFGPEEVDLLRTLGGLADLAIERCVLFARERAFIANAAHELRTPLASLTGLTVTLSTRWHQMSQEQLAQVLEAVERQGVRATDLVNRLLDLAYVEHSGLTLEPVHVSTSVKRALEIAPAPEGVRLSIDVPDDVAVRAEPQRLEQVLTNLLTNAFRHGGPNVTVTASARDGFAKISVADDGPGVPEAMIANVFEPFTRATNARGSGSGLGLAISRKLVEAFGGRLDYEAVEPHGARFVVTLRILEDDPRHR